MSTSPRRRSWIIIAALLVLPLIIGAALAAATGLDPARSWNADEEPAAAPVAASPSGIDPAQLVDARRAAGEAGAQAGFLTTGTEQLTEGVGEMKEGAATLPTQFGEAVTGAQQLSQGMVELQAGVGQLGTGATEVADGVGTAVDQVVGLGALQGQLLGMIDDTVVGLEGATDPDLVDARTRLQDLRGQVEMAQLDGDLANQLTALKDGSREVANQLAVPGYAFHDGIYSATKGAQDLSHGLTEAQGGVDEAVAGVEELDAGVQRIDQMATQTQDRIGAIQRALPVVQAAGTGEGVAAAAASEETIPTLAPMYAMLIAALVMLGGAATGVLMRLTRGGWWILAGATVGLTALGVVLLAIVGTGVTAAVLALSALILALGVVASAVLTRAVIGLFGPVAGSVVAGIAALVQIGLVGWVWKAASAHDVTVIWQVLANLTPLNWATTGLTAAGNDGSAMSLWAAVAVLGVLAAVGVAGLAVAARRASAVTADDSVETGL